MQKLDLGANLADTLSGRCALKPAQCNGLNDLQRFRLDDKSPRGSPARVVEAVALLASPVALNTTSLFPFGKCQTDFLRLDVPSSNSGDRRSSKTGILPS